MWTYVQRTGNMYRDDGTLVWTGYAGHGPGLDKPSMQPVEKIGPLPVGFYSIGTPHQSEHTGAYTMDLTPDATTELFGRSKFRIHGDNTHGDKSASEGCIVKSPKSARELIWNSGDHRLHVVAEEIDRITVT